MTPKSTATPRPWNLMDDGKTVHKRGTGRWIADCPDPADSALIIEAVNMHDDLVRIAQMAVDLLEEKSKEIYAQLNENYRKSLLDQKEQIVKTLMSIK